MSEDGPNDHQPAPTTRCSFDVVIPAYNEESSLPMVLSDLRELDPAPRSIVVADNNWTDATAAVAAAGGARVVPAHRQGYGSACLAALDAIAPEPPDVIVFLDADYSDHPDELPMLLVPIERGEADLVIGSRALGRREPGALLPQARFGNWLACGLIRLIYRHRYTDLGPFRAIRWNALERIGMSDPDFGWTVEMQVKALRKGVPVTEVPVSYRRRVGVSKITGTVAGTLRAGHKILWTILRYSLGG